MRINAFISSGLFIRHWTYITWLETFMKPHECWCISNCIFFSGKQNNNIRWSGGGILPRKHSRLITSISITIQLVVTLHTPTACIFHDFAEGVTKTLTMKPEQNTDQNYKRPLVGNHVTGVMLGDYFWGYFRFTKKDDQHFFFLSYYEILLPPKKSKTFTWEGTMNST